MLTKADYGLAAVFGMAIALVELNGNVAFGSQIVQSKHGDKPGFLASAHSIQFVGGIISAMLLITASAPMARLFKAPHAWWALMLLAVVPMSQAMSHLDVARRQRELVYLPLILVDVVPQFLTTAAAWPLAVWLKDYRVIVWLMIAKALSGTVLTMILARCPYRWGWERAYAKDMLSFGWPLVLTGWVIFGCQQADQLLVGAFFSLNMLANYALAFSLVSIPWFIFSQVGHPLMLPLLSKVQDNPDWFRRRYRICVEASSVIAGVTTVPLIVAAEQLVVVLFGVKYAGAGPFVAVLGSAFSLRFLRLASTTSAMAGADTINQLYSNFWRGTGLVLALLIVISKGTPLQIAGCAVLGEVFAVLASFLRLRRHQAVPLTESSRATIYLASLNCAATAVALLLGAHLSIWSAAVAFIVALFVSLATAWFMFPDLARLFVRAASMHPLHAITGEPAST